MCNIETLQNTKIKTTGEIVQKSHEVLCNIMKHFSKFRGNVFGYKVS